MVPRKLSKSPLPECSKGLSPCLIAAFALSALLQLALTWENLGNNVEQQVDITAAVDKKGHDVAPGKMTELPTISDGPRCSNFGFCRKIMNKVSVVYEDVEYLWQQEVILYEVCYRR